MEHVVHGRRYFDVIGATTMNLLPLEIVLGLQVAAALVIMLGLLADKAEESARDNLRPNNRPLDERRH